MSMLIATDREILIVALERARDAALHLAQDHHAPMSADDCRRTQFLAYRCDLMARDAAKLYKEVIKS